MMSGSREGGVQVVLVYHLNHPLVICREFL